jgi:hypothetical protein
MDKLIELIKKIEDDPKITGIEYEVLSTNHELVKEASSLAECLLITNEGRCDWANINQLISKGYPVYALEKDRFGWLIGGIDTQRGIISYG